MIKNYIFDFGNVLMHFDPDHLTSVYIKDEADKKMVKEILFDRLYWDKLDAGTITDEEVKAAACERLPKNLHEAACRVYDDWVINMEPMEGVAELVADVKKNGGKLYLISNISHKFADEYGKVPLVNGLLSLFDGLVFSSSCGMTKPDPEIFRHLLETYGLKAEECIFIDDRLINIEGAERIGIKGYHFDEDAECLRRTLGF